MDLFIPKNIPDQDWKQLTQNKPYLMRCQPNDHIFLRLGSGKSFYLCIVPTEAGDRVVNSIHYESGEEFLMYNLVKNSILILGRSSEVTIKIMHAIISRKHLEIRYVENFLTITDLGSVNGSYCHVSTPFFNIEEYIAVRPPDSTMDLTLDEVHQVFGPTLDDFLRQYIQEKENNSHDIDSHSEPVS